MKVLMMCCLLVLAVVSSGFAESPEEITILFFEGGYPPFYMAGLEEGMIIDFMKAFDEQHSEFTLIFEGISRKRIDLMMDEGQVQASGLTNPMFVGEKAKDFLFTLPIWTSGNYIMMNKDNVFEYKEPKDLFGKKLGVIFGNRNGNLDPFIESGEIKAMPVNTNSLLYKTLQLGRVDAIIANKHVVPYEMKLEGIDRTQFVFADVPLFEFDLMTQVQKTHQHFVDAFNTFIEQSKENGLLDAITKKYIE